MTIRQKLPAIIPFLFIFLFVSCKNPAPAPDSLTRIPIREENFLLQDSFSNHIKIEKLVRLENHPEALMGIISRIECIDNLIFILKQDQSQELLVFSEKGKYLRKICNKGKGPGEAASLDNFFVDSIQKWVYLVDDGNKVMIKDYEGGLISEFKCPKGASSIVKLDQNTLILAGEWDYQIYLTDNKGKVGKQFMKHDRQFQFGIGFPMIKAGEGALFFRTMDDTLYLINKDTIKPRYLIDFGEKALTRKQYLQFPANSMGHRKIDPQYMYSVSVMGNAGSTLVFQFSYTQKPYLVYSDPDAQKSCIFELREIRKDPKVGKGFFYIASSNPDYFIGYYIPGFMDVDHIPPALASLGPISLEDNPILVFYRFDFGK
ncbi:MAG: 6-bladed beta-propeller [Bacteroidia bacterium]|nr:6-bladed beta-propeller [Bacteroidia bacterium]